MQRAVAEKVKLPPGVSISWSGQFEFSSAPPPGQDRGARTLAIIFVLL